MDVLLVMFKADGSRLEFPLTKDRVVVGRKHNCDLRIPLSAVSRDHCEIRAEHQRLKVRDLSSSNGIFHNHIQVQEAVLSAGDQLRVGPVIFTVVIDGHPKQIKPIRTVLDADTKAGGSTVVDRGFARPKPGDSTDLPTALETDPEASGTDLDNPLKELERLAADETGDETGDKVRVTPKHDNDR